MASGVSMKERTPPSGDLSVDKETVAIPLSLSRVRTPKHSPCEVPLW